jgi:signal transduction histidine kinase
MASKRSTTLLSEVSPQAQQVYADPARLKQILYNLIQNAIKFNVPHGKVFIRVYPSPDHQWILFEVEDTGIGIPENHMPNLFRDFFQVDSRLARTHEGTGLGLALSKKMVENHGGQIYVESQLQKGSLFRFSIPNPKK